MSNQSAQRAQRRRRLIAQQGQGRRKLVARQLVKVQANGQQIQPGMSNGQQSQQRGWSRVWAVVILVVFGVLLLGWFGWRFLLSPVIALIQSLTKVHVWYFVGLLLLFVLVLVLIIAGYTRWSVWTGLGSYDPPNEGHQRGKTLWDWLQLLAALAVPLALGLATYSFNIQQTSLAKQQHDSDQAIAQQQHNADQRGALDQQRAAILQTYLDNIQDLLLNHNLLRSREGDETAELARARTITGLRGLDSVRKGILIQFIYQARLIDFAHTNTNFPKGPIIYLDGADLSNADLSGISLIGANLNGVNLTRANLTNTDLSGVRLASASLGGAVLNGVYLDHTYLDPVRNLTQQQLDHVFSCDKAVLPQGLVCRRHFGAVQPEQNIGSLA